MSTKLTFRPLAQADAQSLFDIYSDNEAMKYRGSKPMESMADAHTYIENQRLQKGTVLTIREGVVLEDSQALIGSVMYRFDDTKAGECEIGYSIGRTFWGKGYGHEIVKMILAALQEREDIEHIVAECHRENMASIKILDRAGFEQAGFEQAGFERVEKDTNSDILVYRKQNTDHRQ